MGGRSRKPKDSASDQKGYILHREVEKRGEKDRGVEGVKRKGQGAEESKGEKEVERKGRDSEKKW